LSAIVGCERSAAAWRSAEASGPAARADRAWLELRHIVDIDFRHARKMGLDKRLFTRNSGRPGEQVSVVVE